MDSEESFRETSLEASSQCSLVINENEIKLSKRRWLILAGVTIFGLLFTFTNQTSPVLDKMLKVVGLSIKKYLYLERLFTYQMALISIPTARFVDKYGIRPAMYLIAALVVVQAVFRGLLYNIHLPYWKDYRISYYIASNVVYIQIIAIYMCLPLKISEIWFSETERSFAWNMMSSFSNISIALASYLYPKLIPSLEDVELLFYINTACAITIVATTVILITRSKPSHPANTRVAQDPLRDKQSFLNSVKKIAKQRDLSLHLIHSAVFDSIYATLVGVIPDILKSANRSEIFTGELNSIFSLLTMVLCLIFANFVHLVKNSTLMCRGASFCQAVLYVTYLTIMLHPAPGWMLYLSSISFAIAKAWTVINLTNMTAHLACGSVSHATVVGVCITMATIASTVIALPFAALIIEHEAGSDYTRSITFISVVCMANEIVFCLFFRGKSAKQMEENTDHEPEQVSA